MTSLNHVFFYIRQFQEVSNTAIKHCPTYFRMDYFFCMHNFVSHFFTRIPRSQKQQRVASLKSIFSEVSSYRSKSYQMLLKLLPNDIDPVFKLSHNQNKQKSVSNKNIDILGVKMRKIYQVQRCEFDLAGGLKSLADLTCEFGEGKVSKLLISLHALPLT